MVCNETSMYTCTLANRFVIQAITSAFCSCLSHLLVWGAVCMNIKQNAEVRCIYHMHEVCIYIYITRYSVLLLKDGSGCYPQSTLWCKWECHYLTSCNALLATWSDHMGTLTHLPSIPRAPFMSCLLPCCLCLVLSHMNRLGTAWDHVVECHETHTLMED